VSSVIRRACIPNGKPGVAIYLNNGTSDPFGNVTPLRLLVGHSIYAIAVADLNNDGKIDLVVAVSDSNLVTGTEYVFLNSGSASQPFTNPQTLQTDNDLGGGCLGVTVGDVNGDGLPDLLFSCSAPLANASPAPANPAVGAIYLNNGMANPFANVAPIDIPATPQSGYGRSVAVGTLVKNGTPDVLIVDAGPGLASYFPTTLDQNPIAQNDSTTVAINKSIEIAVLANDTAGPGQSLNVSSLTITSAPQNGTATVNSTNGSVTYQPAPLAANDTVTLQENQIGTINVLANDTSAGGTLNAASIQIVVPPTHGTSRMVRSPIRLRLGIRASTLFSTPCRTTWVRRLTWPPCPLR
jgi:hypothetical protein